MLKRMHSLILTSAVLGATLLGTTQAAELKELNFGIISTESAVNLKTNWEPFLADMSKKTGMKIKAFFAPDYAGIIQGMRFNKVDVAWYGNKSAMEAVDRAGGEIFVQTVAANGDPGYWSLLITNKDSPLNSVEDVLKNAKNLSFGNGDPNSTSGYLVPSYYVFAKNGVDPVKIFKRTLNSSHEVNALAAANKQVDVATCNTEAIARLKMTNPEKAKQLKIIWKSPLIPSDPIVWRKNLPQETKDKIRTFFLTYGSTPEEKKILANLQWGQFRASNNDQLLPIRQLELFKQRSRTNADEHMDEAEKTAKLKEIDASLEKLSARMSELEKSSQAKAS